MTHATYALLAGTCLLAALVAACSDANDSAASETPGATRTVVPSITREVTTTATPGGAAPTRETVSIEDGFPALPNIARPVAMVEVPNQQTLLIASQDGMVYRIADDPETRALGEALDWSERTSRAGNEEGLLGLALSPDFAGDGHVFLYYSAKGGPRRSVVARFETSGSGTGLRIDPESELVILEVPQPYPNHNGGNLDFGPDGMLYIGLGDGGSGGDPEGNGQNPGTLLGSILRIDVSQSSAGEQYRIPPDNPLVDVPGARPETFAYGFRNPWRFSFDRETGDLWAGDVGQSEREEIDLVVAGGNYGWNVMEGFACYEASRCDQSGLVLPVADYGQEGGRCSVTGGYVARSESAGTLSGWYVYADYCSGRVWALDAARAGERPQPVVLLDEGPQVVSFAEDANGNLYLLAFDGRIYRVTG